MNAVGNHSQFRYKYMNSARCLLTISVELITSIIYFSLVIFHDFLHRHAFLHQPYPILAAGSYNCHDAHLVELRARQRHTDYFEDLWSRCIATSRRVVADRSTGLLLHRQEMDRQVQIQSFGTGYMFLAACEIVRVLSHLERSI